MNIKSSWDAIYNTYYFNFFKKDPCKSCLVQPCCGRACFPKIKWDLYTDFGKNKTTFQLFSLIMVIYAIIVLLYSIIKLCGRSSIW